MSELVNVFGHHRLGNGPGRRLGAGYQVHQKDHSIKPLLSPLGPSRIVSKQFRTGNYEEAYRETLNFKMPECHWDSLLKAAARGQLGKIEEGQAAVQALLALNPDFAQRGRILISRYVKFEDIADRIIEGLGKVGLKIET